MKHKEQLEEMTAYLNVNMKMLKYVSSVKSFVLNINKEFVYRAW